MRNAPGKEDPQIPLFPEGGSEVRAAEPADVSEPAASDSATSEETELYDRLRAHLADRDEWIDKQSDTGRMSPVAARVEAAMEVVSGTRADVQAILRAFDEHETARYRKSAQTSGNGVPEGARPTRSAVGEALDSRSVQERLYDDFEPQYALVAEEVKRGAEPRAITFYSSATGHLEEYRVAWIVAKSVQIPSERRHRANALFRIAHPTWHYE